MRVLAKSSATILKSCSAIERLRSHNKAIMLKFVAQLT